MSHVWNRQYLGASMPVGAQGDMSATFSGPWLPCKGQQLTLALAWSSTPTGTYSLECSYDGGVTAVAVPGAAAEFTANSQAQPAGSASSLVANFTNVPGALWRIKYTRSGSSGTTTAYYTQR